MMPKVTININHLSEYPHATFVSSTVAATQFIALLTPPPLEGLNPFFKNRALFLQVLRKGEYQDFTSTLEADQKTAHFAKMLHKKEGKLYCYPLAVNLSTSHHCTNTGMSDFVRIAGYHSLSTPEALDNLPELWSFSIHQQVSPENLAGQ